MVKLVIFSIKIVLSCRRMSLIIAEIGSNGKRRESKDPGEEKC